MNLGSKSSNPPQITVEMALRQAEVLYTEFGVESRARAKTLWRVVQYFTTAMTGLLALSVALLGLPESVLATFPRAVLVLGLASLASGFGISGLYSWAEESFYWERNRMAYRMVRAEMLDLANIPGREGVAPHRIDLFREMVELGLSSAEGNVWSTIDPLEKFIGEPRDRKLRLEFLRYLKRRGLATSGVRYVMFLTLWILGLVAAFLLGGTLSYIVFLLFPRATDLREGAAIAIGFGASLTVAYMLWISYGGVRAIIGKITRLLEVVDSIDSQRETDMPSASPQFVPPPS